MDRLHMRTVRHHLGIAFELWTHQRTWFWLLAHPARSGRVTIGAAAGESAAIRDACSLIEEMMASRRLADLLASGMKPWEASLSDLERYLACIGKVENGHAETSRLQ
jgi:hypothetical protein